MAHPTVSRADALAPRIARLGADSAQREAVVLGMVDALLAHDGETLSAALDGLRDARARAGGDRDLTGWLDAATAFAHWGLERVPSNASVAPGTQAHDFLSALGTSPQLGSAELRSRLDVDETQVSRTGRRLLESGLVTRRKAGRQVFWQLTPRGREALEQASTAKRSGGSEFWQEALRRGFDAASGDEPGEPREVDPMRERIIENTLELHVTQGIKATTREHVAAKVAVPLETIDELFPAPDDLVRSCAQHFMESLQLPPRDRAPEVFAGAPSEEERIHRLVGTFFGAYERGADGITTARRERDVPVVDETLGELESTFDALVLEALRPQHPDSSSVASLRALTDVDVWRNLRDHGAAPDAAVEQASEAVERWLEARAAR
jgi:DNA-binding MarR family transcriptional regulator